MNARPLHPIVSRAGSALALLTLLTSGAAAAQGGFATGPETFERESPRTGAATFRGGFFTPLIDREPGLGGGNPFEETFEGPMLLIEGQFERLLWKGFGTASVGFSIGYAEKYGYAQVVEDDGQGGSTLVDSAETTGFFVLPLRLSGIYRFDWASQEHGIPLVPYVQLGLAYTPWWSSKGGEPEVVEGRTAAGGKWGAAGAVGIAFLLDVLDQRTATDFDVDLGVNNSYLFVEYHVAEVNDFGQGGLDLSSRHFMFGLTLEY